MVSSRIARAVGVASLGVLVYVSPIDSTQAASHCGPKGTVNKGGTCDCDQCSISTGPAGDAHCAPKQKPPAGCTGAVTPAPLCGGVGKPPCAIAQKGVVPLDYNNMISIKGGSFTAGSSDSKDSDAGPMHAVTLSDYKMDKYEVPVAEYAKCVAAKKCAEPPKDLEAVTVGGNRCNWSGGRKAHPMNCVTFTEANSYCAWKSKRLPTEAEWEYAAKGGSKNNVFPWGSTDPTCKNANFTSGPMAVGCGDGTAPIGTKPAGASAFGVHDLSGNVEEWTMDFWGNFSGMSPNAPNPVAPKSTTSLYRHTVKGSSWDLSLATDLHGVRREPVDENTRMNWLGFRCVTGPTPVPAPEMMKKEDPGPPPPPPPPKILPPQPAPNVPPPGDLGAMIKVTGATFQMGSDADTLSSPVHPVTLASYEIDKYEVSVAQYKQCVVKGQCAPPLLLQVSQNCNYNAPGREDHPVNCVEWSDAKRYCTAMGKRLPTEAEWEFAARGPTNRPYPWGANEPTCSYAAFSPADKQKCASSTQVVGTHPLGASYFGVMDMGGNVEEWVYDFFGDYNGGPSSNPQGPATNENAEHAVRGGNFNADAFTLHSYGRWHQTVAADWVGFRCAKN